MCVNALIRGYEFINENRRNIKKKNRTNIVITNGNYYENFFQKKKLKLLFLINKKKGNKLVTGKLAANITVK